MAITRYSSFDKKVQTIAERNAIARKVDGMTVVVADAIADVNAGAGKAVYRWDASESVWILISKETTETLSFSTEELTITNGQVTLSNFPTDGQVWGMMVMDGDIILGDVRYSDITVVGADINGLIGYDGKKLKVTYAYGSVAQQISTAIDSEVDARFQELIDQQSTIVAVEDITTDVEFTTNTSRNGSRVYGIEIDVPSLPNTDFLEIPFTFDETFTYWIDAQHSYATSANETISLPYFNGIGEVVTIKLDLANDKIVIGSGNDKSSFNGKLVLLYTK